jgi:hypothetical protein
MLAKPLSEEELALPGRVDLASEHADGERSLGPDEESAPRELAARGVTGAHPPTPSTPR